jgi:hypothetical protein
VLRGLVRAVARAPAPGPVAELSPSATTPADDAANRSDEVPRLIVAATVTTVVGLVVFQVLAAGNSYARRVIGDTPSFMTLVRDMAIHPLAPVSIFFGTGTGNTNSIHASPYLQLLGLIWRIVAPSGKIADPTAIGQFMAIAAIPLTMGFLVILWLYTRELAGRRAAFIAIPALMSVFGPIHLAFPSDLTFNGFLYAGYYPTTVASGLTLATLVMLRRTSWRWTAATVIVAALTVTADPLNGAVMSALVTVFACQSSRRRRSESVRVPLVLAGAFGLARLWPPFDIFSAFASSGLPVSAVLLVAFAAPRLWLYLAPRLPGVACRAATFLIQPRGRAAELAVAIFGAYATAMLAVVSIYTMRHWPQGHPYLTANRLGFYWNDQRDRWLLLVAANAVGLIGLQRLAKRGEVELPLWFIGAYAVGVAGAAAHASGIELPLYYRFILLCQVPIAIGTACFLARPKNPMAGRVTAVGLAFVLVFNIVTLVGVSGRLSYFGTRLPSAWRLGQVIPRHSGVVASDSATSYYVPITSDNRVLTVGLGHADSGAESDMAKAGYLQLREVYAGGSRAAAQALQTMWREGVRWVVVEKFTTFAPPILKQFYSTPYSGLIGLRDIELAARYNSRLIAVGDVVADDGEFTVYELDPTRIAADTGGGKVIAPYNGDAIRQLLYRLLYASPRLARVIARELLGRGVSELTLDKGWLGSQPSLSAYGADVADPTVVTIAIPRRGIAFGCKNQCAQVLGDVEAMGHAELSDSRYEISRLRSPHGYVGR